MTTSPDAVRHVAQALCTAAGYQWPCAHDRYSLKVKKEAVSKWWIELAEHAIEAMENYIEPHIHVAGTTIGKHIDTCAKCGHDLRHESHLRGMPGDGWQPIETAPKDAGYIMGAWRDGSRWRASTVYWNAHEGEWVNVFSDIFVDPDFWIVTPDWSKPSPAGGEK